MSTFSDPNFGQGHAAPSWFSAAPAAKARPTAAGKVTTPYSARDLPAFREINQNGVVYVGFPWIARGRIIVNAANGTNDAFGTTWATAEGATYTAAADGGSGTDLDVATFNAPDWTVCIVNEVDILVDSEIAWQLLQFALVVGGGSNQAASGAVGRVLNRDTTKNTRPPDRFGRFTVDLRCAPGSTARLQVTNKSLESQHLVEVEMRGRLFPAKLLEGKE